MKYFPLILFFALIFAFAGSAQTDQTLNCPSISVSGSGLVNPGEPMFFTAKVENYDLSKLSFKWTISGGEFLDGQGTLSIKVLKKDNNENITATIEVEGVPEGCWNIISETAAICGCVNPRLFDEFSTQSSQINKERLDNLINEIQGSPNETIYIIEYFKSGTPTSVINRKIRKLPEYLIYQKKLEKEKFTILAESQSEKNLTKVWIVPPGAENPTIEN